MDTLAHAIYGAAIVAHTRDEKKILLAGIAGMLPDLIVQIPIWAKVGLSLPNNYNFPPEFMNLYYSTHNFFVPAIAFLLLPKKWKFLALAYGSHVLLDIPTHCGIFATRFLYPLSNFNICAFSYGDSMWAWELNYGLLIGIFYLIYLKFYKPYLSDKKQTK